MHFQSTLLLAIMAGAVSANYSRAWCENEAGSKLVRESQAACESTACEDCQYEVGTDGPACTSASQPPKIASDTWDSYCKQAGAFAGKGWVRS
ncbi:hypothetical protein HYFRA_00012789 [Hymenoscyphus fraxineus]|uniref:Uncharacterized protein n=1 Tax=Hymenoscyphus fraxineus TaxID=746836 RepID=A0A9N9L6B9_9HELO|nr:hypothetical protein HYFRA_00012789 [Hymenoscyphus fraxineus]